MFKAKMIEEMEERRALEAVILSIIYFLSFFFMINENFPLPENLNERVIGYLFSFFFLSFYAMVYYWTKPKIPFTWFLIAAFSTLFINLFPLGILLNLSLTIFIFLSPYILYLLSPSIESEISDAEVLEVAKKYGGILTKSLITYELKIDLKNAEKCLDKFCKYGEAIKKVLGNIIIYDFPGIRAYLSRADNEIIELLLKNYSGMSKADLLKATGFSIETLEESLKRLETKGIIQYDQISSEYKLRGISI